MQDIINEPDSMGMGWEPANGKPGAGELYIATMDALNSLSSQGWLYMVEGAGQTSFGLNWVSRPISTSKAPCELAINLHGSRLLQEELLRVVIAQVHVCCSACPQLTHVL